MIITVSEPDPSAPDDAPLLDEFGISSLSGSSSVYWCPPTPSDYSNGTWKPGSKKLRSSKGQKGEGVRSRAAAYVLLGVIIMSKAQHRFPNRTTQLRFQPTGTSHVERILQVLDHVRKQLCLNGFPSLSSFPITELTTSSATATFAASSVSHSDHKSFLGLTDIQFHNWSAMDRKLVSTSITVRSLAVRLRPVVCENALGEFNADDDSNVFELIRVLPTFLHELAHCLTQGVLATRPEVYGRHLKMRVQRGGGRDKTNVPCHFHGHTDEFYNNFAAVLSKAHQLGFFILPDGSSASIIAKETMKKLDDLDIERARIDTIGRTSLSL